MEEDHMGWKLVRGVRRDVLHLLKEFEKTKSIRFVDFCKIWKEMKFSHIFLHRNVYAEMIEFSQELMNIVKSYIQGVYEFPYRVGALYLLYGLYFKQPLIGCAKICLTKSEWICLSELVEKAKSEHHFDVVFVHLKLYTSGAYNFTCTIRAAGLGVGNRKYDCKRFNGITKIDDADHSMKTPVIAEDQVNAFLKMESLYCNKKKEFLGKNDLSFIDANFYTKLKSKLEQYVKGTKKQTQKKSFGEVEVDDDNDNDSDSDSDSEDLTGEDEGLPCFSSKALEEKSDRSKTDKSKPHDIGELRVQLKNKTFKRKLENLRNQDVNEITTQIQIQDTETTNKAKAILKHLQINKSGAIKISNNTMTLPEL